MKSVCTDVQPPADPPSPVQPHSADLQLPPPVAEPPINLQTLKSKWLFQATELGALCYTALLWQQITDTGGIMGWSACPNLGALGSKLIIGSCQILHSKVNEYLLCGLSYIMVQTVGCRVINRAGLESWLWNLLSVPHWSCVTLGTFLYYPSHCLLTIKK